MQARFFKALSELRKNVGEQDIRQEKETKAHVDDEEQRIPVASIVGRQHDVWEIGCGEQHEHLEVGLRNALEVGVALVLLAVDEEGQG